MRISDVVISVNINIFAFHFFEQKYRGELFSGTNSILSMTKHSGINNSKIFHHLQATNNIEVSKFIALKNEKL